LNFPVLLGILVRNPAAELLYTIKTNAGPNITFNSKIDFGVYPNKQDTIK